MGNQHAVYLAQTALRHLVNKAILMADKEMPNGRPINFLVFCYIDDVAFLGPPDWVACLTACFDFLAVQQGLSIKTSKSLNSVSSITMLGFCINFVSGTIGITEKRCRSVSQDVLNLLSKRGRQAIDRGELIEMWEKVLGRIVWIMTLRRSLLCVLDSTFAHLEQARRTSTILSPNVKKRRRTDSIWVNAEARDELLAAARLLPLCRSGFWSERTAMIISDASDTGIGVGLGIQSPLPLLRQHHRLQHINGEKPLIELTVPPKSVFTFFGRALNDKQKRLQIAARELFALTTACRAWARKPAPCQPPPAPFNHRLVVAFQDNTAVICCVEKGRANSKPLNLGLRLLAGYMITLGFSLEMHYVPSADNHADYWSRLLEHAPAD
jgi:hypothetical protein